MSDCSFFVARFEYPLIWCTESVVLVIWLVLRETTAVSARSVYTIQPCTIPRHFVQSHIHRVHAFLAVTCHLLIWQNDQDLLRATAVTWGWNRYRNNSQHRKFPWRRKFARRLCLDRTHALFLMLQSVRNSLPCKVRSANTLSNHF